MHFDQTHARLLKKFQTPPDSLYIRAWTEISVFIVKYWHNVLFVIHTVIVFDWTLLVPWSILHGKFASTSNLIQRLDEEYANYFRINFKGLSLCFDTYWHTSCMQQRFWEKVIFYPCFAAFTLSAPPRFVTTWGSVKFCWGYF